MVVVLKQRFEFGTMGMPGTGSKTHHACAYAQCGGSQARRPLPGCNRAEGLLVGIPFKVCQARQLEDTSAGAKTISVQVKWDTHTDSIEVGKQHFGLAAGNVLLIYGWADRDPMVQQLQSLDPHANAKQVLKHLRER